MSLSTGWIARLLALIAFAAVLVTLADPGITVDEPLDVRPGRNYVETLRAKGWRCFDRETSDRVYLDNKEHPPLGRWLLGIASTLGQDFQTSILGPDPAGVYVVAGRVAPALCFALLVGLVASEAGRRYGRAAGAAAGLALLVMPRCFGHAHIAALDTFVALFWTLAFLSAERALTARRPLLAMVIAGACWGLVLLTKIHGWLLLGVVPLWAFVRLPPRKAVLAVVIWLVAGLAVFFGGWPWLWFDTWDRLAAYLNTGVNRTSIRVEYFGRIYQDRDVPFHYPWVMFAVTVPIGLHLLALAGVVIGFARGAADRFTRLCVFVILCWLILFSTRVPVYDGERLFLPVFPLWAILAGNGFQALWDRFLGRLEPPRSRTKSENLGLEDEPPAKPRRRRPLLAIGLVALLLGQAWGVGAIHPFGLSYYNALVGGLAGAQWLGLERTYWSEAVDPVLLKELAQRVKTGETVALAPTLAPNQGVFCTSLPLYIKGIVVRDEDAVSSSDWVLVWRRVAYWRPEVVALVHSTRPKALRSRDGVWLAGLWRRGDPSPELPAEEDHDD